MILYAVTTFVGAFLLFQIQPMMAKYILPWFGGGAHIWTTCLLFFQVMLLGGYSYAHLLSSRLKRSAQATLHMCLLGISIAVYLLAPAPEFWKPEQGSIPSVRIFLLLLVTIGMPYFMLSSTSPLIQRWFSWSFTDKSPYRLYALSNIGSLLALLSYPILIEPLLPLSLQVSMWSWTYSTFVALCYLCAFRVFKMKETSATAEAPSTSSSAEYAVSGRTLTHWLAFSAIGSIMLLATTNQLCREVAVVPFLWVLPLSLYLLTFIICFDNERWYDRRVFGALLLVATPIATQILIRGANPSMKIQISAYLLVMFAGCMCCHGELARSKPSAGRLTLFYLTVSAGGALGGVFVALLAPRIFLGYWEYHVGLWGCCFLTFWAWYRCGDWRKCIRHSYVLWTPLALFQILLTLLLISQIAAKQRDRITTQRNFYGVASVSERIHEDDIYRVLRHGRIVHGIQNTVESKMSWPTSYFGTTTGLGLALTRFPGRAKDPPRGLQVGILGLGIGTIACYGQEPDTFHFYEINPDVIEMAHEYFTYLDDSQAKIEVRLGDGRIQMESVLDRHPRGQLYDVMVFDAFSSDAIPIHLITKECVALYFSLLKPNGLLVFNISNRFVDLTPVCRGLAETFDCPTVLVHTEDDLKHGQFGTSWVIFTHNQAFLDDASVQAANAPWPDPNRPALHWSDDFSSLWKALHH